MSLEHEPVLLEEVLEALITRPDGYYVDGTFGRGGHSRRILERLNNDGRLLAVDKDPQAIAVAATLKESDPRLDVCQGSFALLPHQLHRRGIDAVDGIFLDLGVSSPQLDQGERGFSFTQDGPLDMRMDTSTGETAAQWLERASEAEITRTLFEYGEERFARRIARALVTARAELPITSTARLAAVAARANPKWEKHKHPATRTFQAIRIQVNRELDDLESLLPEAVKLLRAGGRLVVISFHSLEDRIVKRFMRTAARGASVPRGLPVLESALGRELRLVGKALRPSESEIAHNPRARSAVLRVAERLPMAVGA